MAKRTIFPCASAICVLAASPYTFIVVRMSEFRISFCCTPIQKRRVNQVT
jgi:hypothetical protein